ncbi:hypothetical protein BGW38_000293 [Lunasporangiospora selenospora]|uniref:Uncharacterized protein n=1 Tax=Lunasporangiospora selenospora TaxID=979761 RepID=A0A9P6FX77_9FUNG|nr:hypothetical protein BGW38_000293 [Lunasporangiospora selenospora]
MMARRASSQQEQVWMDLLRPTPADSLNTIEASATMTNSNSVNDTLEKVWKNASPDAQTRVAAGAMPKTTLNYLDAAASIPSSWPMAPWAIRTEAALMEFEAIYRDDAGPIMPPTAMQSALSLENDIRSVAGPSAEFNEVEQWSREFLNAVSASAPTTATAKEMSQETKSDPSKDSIGTHSTLQEQPSQRRGSLKTCGFMWDGKRTLQNEYPEATLDELYAAEFLQETEAGLQSEGEKNFPLREAQEPSLSLVAGSEPMTYRTDVMTPSPVTPLLDTWALEREQVQECIADFDRTREQEEVQNQRGKREMEQAVQGGYNDDVFESDMLTAWMETLAQEKKESVEQKAVAEAKLQRQEQSKETASAEDSVILEMAVRRLNALMHQLDRRPVVRSTPGSIQVL